MIGGVWDGMGELLRRCIRAMDLLFGEYTCNP